MTRQLARFLSLGVLTAALVGCGQKGPLFLPQEKLDEIERKRDERKADEAPARTGRLSPLPTVSAAA